jgi:nitrile hydratase accessory protein
MYQPKRNLVRRHDNRLVNVARARGHLFVCSNACCCGRTEDGMAPVPTDLYHREWEERRLRNIVHLTIGGCLGPCALANIAMLLFDGQTLWFHSVNSDAVVLALYDYIEQLLDADRVLPPPPALAPLQFTASTWQPRPDGQPVEDRRRWRGSRQPAAGGREAESSGPHSMPSTAGCRLPTALDLDAPRKNGELVFEAPWQGRAFGMAVALNDQQLYPWDEFRDRLIAEIARAERENDGSEYYERWLAAFESLLADKGIVTKDELDERTFEFEFGERDEVF